MSSDESGAAIAGIIFNKDGSFQRVPTPDYPDVPPTPTFDNGVASKDIVLDPERNLWVRLYLPAGQAEKKKPVVVYFHGGGFVILNPSTVHFHKLCERMAVTLGSIVVSVGYRLAPEHKLPAAYEDGFSVLQWLDASATRKKQATPEPWLDTADFSRVFLAGDSAGGNISHHLSVRAAHQPESLSFKLAGQILLQPFFSGVSRTNSELTLSGPFITLPSCDLCWKVALPEGASRDHGYCNVAPELPEVMKKGFAEKTLVVVGGMDLLKDRQIEYAKIVEEGGRNVKMVMYEKSDHAFYALGDTEETKHLFQELVNFTSRTE